MIADTFDYILDRLELSGDEPGEVSIPCPFHDDTDASASINLEKGMFNCHSANCGKSYRHLSALAEALREQEGDDLPEPVVAPVPVMSVDPTGLEELALSYLASRGFPEAEVPGMEFEVETTPGLPTTGYLLIKSRAYGDRFVGRNLLRNDNPRYYNSPGEKDLFFLDTYDPHGDHVWLVEGIFDAASLAHLGITQIAAALGSKVSPQYLYSIRHQTVFILFDDDYAGYSGARKVAEKLQELGGNPILVDMHRDVGSDPNDALTKNPERFAAWLAKQVGDYSSNDRKYVETFLENNTPLQVIPSGLPTLDMYLGGGFKDGVAIIGAEPGVGKTSFATWFSAMAATIHGKRVLYVTYEISKRQVWSRIAAIASGENWDVLEMEPGKMRAQEAEWVRRLSKNIRVAVGWSVNKIKHVVHKYDLIVVDYLQRMPGKPGEDHKEDRVNVSFNIKELSNLGRDHGKIILAISSLARTGYGQVTLKSFKESGDIEYAVQAAIALTRHYALEESTQGVLDLTVLKNTRGQEGKCYLRPDLGHQIFVEAEPQQPQKETES